jgi:hypothetical protein
LELAELLQANVDQLCIFSPAMQQGARGTTCDGRLPPMIRGAHFLLFSRDPEADRAFFRDVLNFPAVDLGDGWLIFALPPAEMAIHPGTGDFLHLHAGEQLSGALLYLMCDDLRAVLPLLESKNIAYKPVAQAEWGLSTTVTLPSGGQVGLYQPAHVTAIKTEKF